mmetsp:Transcript_25178/g.47567  ORF Transcript_25178/g.47567 Transcript_25178/m.47567 type:complete len:244 (-) Transcript_25178:547-1278(-)
MAMHCCHQKRGAVVHIFGLDVGPCTQEHGHHFHVAVPCGQEQRSLTRRVCRVDNGLVRQKHCHQLGGLDGCCESQHRVPVPVGNLQVHAPIRYQHLHGLHVPLRRGQVAGRRAVQVLRVGVGAVVAQRPDHRAPPSLRGVVQRDVPRVLVHVVHVAPFIGKQAQCAVELALYGCLAQLLAHSVQHGHALPCAHLYRQVARRLLVLAWNLWVGTVVQQHFHHGGVAVVTGFVQRRVSRSSKGSH